MYVLYLKAYNLEILIYISCAKYNVKGTFRHSCMQVIMYVFV